MMEEDEITLFFRKMERDKLDLKTTIDEVEYKIERYKYFQAHADVDGFFGLYDDKIKRLEEYRKRLE